MTWPFESPVLDIESSLENGLNACTGLYRDIASGFIPDCAPAEIAWELQGCIGELLDLIKKYRAEAIEAAEWLNPKHDDTDPGPSQEQRS